MLPFCNIVLHAQKPYPPGYPTEPKTIGDHIKRRRYELRLTQTQAAEMIGVHRPALSSWERNSSEPEISLIPKIMEFLGYVPYGDISNMNGGKKIIAARAILGMSQKRAAKILGVCEDTLRSWENDESVPSRKKTLQAIESLFNSASHIAETLESR